MRILLVDDSGTMRTIQKRCLLKLGVAEQDIVEAENGQVGLSRFTEQQFDIVMTDWNMPVMDGLSLLKEIRCFHFDQVMEHGQRDRFVLCGCIVVSHRSHRSRVRPTASAAHIDSYLCPHAAFGLILSRSLVWLR